ncbi:MAG: DUF4127 family protein, partial [Blastocatellia bacterium]
METSAGSFQLAEMTARVSDHELVVPTRAQRESFLLPRGNEPLLAWVKQQDYAELDGAILAVTGDKAGDKAATASMSAALKQALEILQAVRRKRASFRVSLCLEKGANEEESLMPLLRLAGDFAATVDGVLLSGRTLARAGETPEALKNKTSMFVDPRSGEMICLAVARMLNQRFGFAPRFQTIFSVAKADPARLAEASVILQQITAAGGNGAPFTPEAARRADILLFAQTSDTSAAELKTFMATLARAVESGRRVVLIDMAVDQASRVRLVEEIRTRRLLDQLYAFGATPETATELSAQSGAPAIAQASARLVAAKFLRDDNARLLRMERAQIELSLTGWLASRVYPSVFPAIESCRAERPEQTEACATGEMRKLASEHFSEQFRHNVHSVMNSAGQRVEFRVRAIQRFDVRFPGGNMARPEIRPRVYLFQ